MLSLLINGLALLTPAPQGLPARSTTDGLSRRAVLGGAFGGAVLAGYPALASAKTYAESLIELNQQKTKLEKDEADLQLQKDNLKKAEAKLKADKKFASSQGLKGTDCQEEICLEEKEDLKTIAALKTKIKEDTQLEKQLKKTIENDAIELDVMKMEAATGY